VKGTADNNGQSYTSISKAIAATTANNDDCTYYLLPTTLAVFSAKVVNR
jgi:hypothetical protein